VFSVNVGYDSNWFGEVEAYTLLGMLNWKTR
jgi:hypothetical protein